MHTWMQSFEAYGNGDSKNGFWGVLAQKAKSMLNDNNSTQQHDTKPQTLKSHSFNTFQGPSATQVIIIYNVTLVHLLVCSMQCRNVIWYEYEYEYDAAN